MSHPLTAPEQAPEAGVADAIVRTVAYADVFDYPLRAGEVHRYLLELRAPASTIQHLLSNGYLVPHRLSRQQEYFALPGRENIIATRQQRAQTAAALWPLAIAYGRLMARLPFVRMVAVTGSLAVNNADANADVDYLIVAANDRVWLARACVILIVRLARRRSHIELCPNFILSERALAFPPTLYNAREIAQMMPLSGLPVYHQLRQANPWTSDFLPNAAGLPENQATISPAAPPGWPARFVEAVLRTPAGSALEKWEMQRKIRRFRQLTDQHTEANFTADWCKGHFHDHSQRIMAAYRQRLNDKT